MTVGFSSESMETTTKMTEHFSGAKEKICHTKILYPGKTSFRNEDEK